MSLIAVLTTAMSSMSIAVASETTASVQLRCLEAVCISSSPPCSSIQSEGMPAAPFRRRPAGRFGRRPSGGAARGNDGLNGLRGRARSAFHDGQRAHVPRVESHCACAHRRRSGRRAVPRHGAHCPPGTGDPADPAGRRRCRQQLLPLARQRGRDEARRVAAAVANAGPDSDLLRTAVARRARARAGACALMEDGGLALERTQLAWQRYTLGVAVVAILSMRAGLRGKHELAAFGIAFVLAALAATLQLLGPRANPRRAVHLALVCSLTAAAGSLILALL